MPRFLHTTAIAQIKTVPSSPAENVRTILTYINEAREAGAELVVFPELSTSGYLLGDRWEYDSCITELEEANERVREESRGITVIWGSIKADRTKIGEDGRIRKYNAAFIARDGAWVSNSVFDGWVPKTNLPNYRMFDDSRHFFSAAKLSAEMNVPLAELLRPFPITIGGKTLQAGLTICEDIWEEEYAAKISEIYRAHRPDLLVNIAQSPWTRQKFAAREKRVAARAHDVNAPILYVNAVGLQNNGKNLIWFDGSSNLTIPSGDMPYVAPAHTEGLFLLSSPPPSRVFPSDTEEVHAALIHAMRDFFAPFPRVVVGLSGGIDSAVSCALLVQALGKERVLAINMPTRFNSQMTQRLARECAQNLGVEYTVVPIDALYEAQARTVESAGFALSRHAHENVQARIRGNVLATIAAAVDGVFVNNGNKTEIALNYFTLYGDGAGAASFLGDLWKGEVYAIASLINARAKRNLIPQGILSLTPSAELSPEQNVDEGKGDPIFYPYHDALLKAFTEKRWTPEVVLSHALAGTLEQELGCEPGTIGRYFSNPSLFIENLEWVWRGYANEWKRVQLPPLFITSHRAFGFDRRDTIAPAPLSERYHKYKKHFIAEGGKPLLTVRV